MSGIASENPPNFIGAVLERDAGLRPLNDMVVRDDPTLRIPNNSSAKASSRFDTNDAVSNPVDHRACLNAECLNDVHLRLLSAAAAAQR